MRTQSLLIRGFAVIGALALLTIGFQNCGAPNYISPIDLASAAGVGPIVQVYPSAATSIPTAWTKVTFDTAELDTNNSLDAVNHRLLPPQPGYYRVHLNVFLGMTGTAGFTTGASIYKNGAAYKTVYHLINYAAGFTQTMQVDAIVYLNGTSDYIEGYATTNSGTGSIANGSASSWLSADFIRSQ